MAPLRVYCSLILFVSLLSARGWCSARELKISSQAELWIQRDPSEKAAYLDGICDGFEATGNLAGELMCAPLEMQVKEPDKAKQYPGFRLCGIRWPDLRSRSKKDPNGLEILDAFYRNAAHSDVPVSLAIVAYNDRACHENNSGIRIQRTQAIAKCFRQLNNMRDVPDETRAAQKSVCDKLRQRKQTVEYVRNRSPDAATGLAKTIAARQQHVLKRRRQCQLTRALPAQLCFADLLLWNGDVASL